MGLNKFYTSGMIRIYFRIEECFPEREDLKFLAHISWSSGPVVSWSSSR